MALGEGGGRYSKFRRKLAVMVHTFISVTMVGFELVSPESCN